MTKVAEARVIVAVLIGSRNRRARQDVTSQFDTSSRTFAAAKGSSGGGGRGRRAVSYL